MADFTNSPNMGLPIPTVGAAAGPLYAQYVDACFLTVDGHTHNPGSGVQITPSGLNISSDLSFNSNNAILLRTTRFSPQASAISSSAPDQGCLYVATISTNNELFYNDSSGNQVQITTGGAINATGSGISNGTVQAVINGHNVLYASFISSGLPADIQGASFILGSSSDFPFQYQVNPPSISSNETITLPLIPASTQFLQIDNTGGISSSINTSGGITGSNIAIQTVTGAADLSGGNIALATITHNNIDTETILGGADSSGGNIVSGTITGGKNSFGVSNIAANTITQSNMAILAPTFSSTVTSGQISSSSPTYTGLQKDITTTGGAVLVTFGSGSFQLLNSSGSSNANGTIYLYRTDIGQLLSQEWAVVVAPVSFGNIALPSSSILFIDTGPVNAGAHYTYQLYLSVTSAAGTPGIRIVNTLMTLTEL